MKATGMAAGAALLVLLFSVAAQAQEPDMDAAMAAYLEAAQPGEEHEWLAGMAGEFEVTTKMWMDASGEPTVSTSTQKAEMALGGRYLMDHYSGSFAGMPFEGMGITGYDNTTGVFVSSWIDNLGTGILYSTGKLNEDGQLVMVGKYKDPYTKEMSGMKAVTWKTDDGYVSVLYNLMPDGTEFKSMELTAKRLE